MARLHRAIGGAAAASRGLPRANTRVTDSRGSVAAVSQDRGRGRIAWRQASERTYTRPMEIRRARPDEWQALRDLRLRALATDPDAFGSTLAGSSTRTDAEWQERANPPDGAVFVAASRIAWSVW